MVSITTNKKGSNGTFFYKIARSTSLGNFLKVYFLNCDVNVE